MNDAENKTNEQDFFEQIESQKRTLEELIKNLNSRNKSEASFFKDELKRLDEVLNKNKKDKI